MMEGSQVVFQETVETFNAAGNPITETYEYQVDFDIPEFKNVVGFTIPDQVVKGVKLYEDANLNAHGYYEVEDTNGSPINSLNFKVSVNGTVWTYSLQAQ